MILGILRNDFLIYLNFLTPVARLLFQETLRIHYFPDQTPTKLRASKNSLGEFSISCFLD